MDKWQEWRRIYAERCGESVIVVPDGAGADYSDASPRILFVLKDPNAKGQDVSDVRTWDARRQLDKGPEGITWKAVARWAVALGTLWSTGSLPPRKEANDPELMRKALRASAAINLKKVAGGSSIAPEVLHAHAHQFRDVLREQIALLNPEIIVACGTGDQLRWLLDLASPPDSAKYHIAWTPSDVPVVMFQHPARPGDGYAALRNVVENSPRTLVKSQS